MKVCIIQPVLKGYRLAFFKRLAEHLTQSGIALHVVYGRPWAEEAKRGDQAHLDAPLGMEINSHMLMGRLLWMPVLRPWLDADLVVVEHANKHVLNFPLAALSRLGLKRVAYWGHGRGRQAPVDSAGERFKRRSLHWADWWFAYTADAARYVTQQGFDPQKITVVQNAIDTDDLRRQLAAVTESGRARWLRELAWPADSRIAVYCGSLYENKRIDLLMDAADQVHASHPAFKLLIIGAGPLSAEVEAYAKQRNWVYAAGSRFGDEKAELLSLAEMWLNPGLVGLGILDAFCARLPLLTSDLPGHGPEIEYLQPGSNGLLTVPEARAFAQAVESLLDEPARLEAMRAEAEAASFRYSIEAMANNFSEGVRQCLGRS